MLLYPAIDLKDGVCVRLVQGEMNQAIQFNDDPAAQAQAFVEQGAEWIHVVDLNGAFEGKRVNGEQVKAICAAVQVPLQLGGGIRDIPAIEESLDLGIQRVVLGTAALRKPMLVIDACRRFPEQIAVGIDAKNGKVAVQGWAETSDISVLELAKRFEDAGVAVIIYTNISRDGMMKGPDVDGIKELAEAISIPVIASGGVSSLDDLRALKAIEPLGLNGVICGRAIYEGKVDIASAIEILR